MLHQQRGNSAFYFRIRALARYLRKHSTPAEIFFWEKVRDRRFLGLKFNRQYILVCRIEGNIIKYYIPDFYCHAYRLIVELDGQIHLKQAESDLIRTEIIHEFGYTVIRFSNEEVLFRWNEVEERLKRIFKSMQPNSYLFPFDEED